MATSDKSTSSRKDVAEKKENISTNPAPTARPDATAVPNPKLATLIYGWLIF
jgi:hypothetical protein